MVVSVTKNMNDQGRERWTMNQTKLDILLNDIENLMDALEELHTDLVEMNTELEHNLSEIE